MPPVQYLPSPWPLSFLHGSNRHIHLDSLKGDASIPGRRRDPIRRARARGQRPRRRQIRAGQPHGRRRRAPLVLSHRACFPVRASPAAAAPRLRLLQRLGAAAAASLLALAHAFAGPRLCCWCRLRLRAGGRSPRSARLTSCTTRPCPAQSGGSRSGGIARRLRRPRGTTH